MSNKGYKPMSNNSQIVHAWRSRVFAERGRPPPPVGVRNSALSLYPFEG